MGGFINDWAAFVLKSGPQQNAPDIQTGPWRPPGWNQPQRVSLSTTLPGLPATSVTSSSTVDGALVPDDSGSPAASTQPEVQGQAVTYYFDAVLRVDHNEEVVITRHPVQIGAAISDHAYAMPAVVVLDVKFSDAQQSPDATQYTGGSVKSVAAYQAIKNVKDLGLPCTLVTHLNTYENMVIENISAMESSSTVFGAHFVVRLLQVLTGTVSTNTISARPDQNNSTNEGTKNSGPPSQSVVNQLQDIANPNQWNSNTKPNLVPSN